MDKLLNATQVAQLLGCSRASVFEWAAQGVIPSVRVGGRLVRFEPQEISRWLEDRRRDQEGPVA
jgi:excisionase family DNA binding protein